MYIFIYRFYFHNAVQRYEILLIATFFYFNFDVNVNFNFDVNFNWAVAKQMRYEATKQLSN